MIGLIGAIEILGAPRRNSGAMTGLLNLSQTGGDAGREERENKLSCRPSAHLSQHGGELPSSEGIADLLYTRYKSSVTEKGDVVDQLLPPHIFREEIHNFIRVIKALKAERHPSKPRLSREERAAVAYYLQELHQFLRDQETETDPSQHLLAL
jgi:hypothetical protein